LRNHGIHVPVLPAVSRIAGNAKLLATALSGYPSPSFQRSFPEIDVSKLDPVRIVAELLEDWRSDQETVVLSAETFRPNHAQSLRELLPTTVTCTVILFVRRQDQWVDSYFNQLIKTNDIADDIGTFVARLCNTEEERLCRPDWALCYETWRDAFGACEVVFYDEVKSDVFAAFLSAAGLEPVPDLIDVEHAQVSLDIHQLAYLLEWTTSVSFPEFAQRRSACEEASRRLGRQETRSLLSTADRLRLRERFEASNAKLMTMLGRAADETPLRFDTVSRAYCDLRELYASEPYARYRELANAIYAGDA
jgi:hypothetical protein